MGCSASVKHVPHSEDVHFPGEKSAALVRFLRCLPKAEEEEEERSERAGHRPEGDRGP